MTRARRGLAAVVRYAARPALRGAASVVDFLIEDTCVLCGRPSRSAGSPDVRRGGPVAHVHPHEHGDGEGHRAHDRERFSRRMIERVLTQFDDGKLSCEENDLEYLLTKMADLPSDISVHQEAA